jgi:hypothetical protein
VVKDMESTWFERRESMLCDQHFFEGEVDNLDQNMVKIVKEETFLSKEDRRTFGF